MRAKSKIFRMKEVEVEYTRRRGTKIRIPLAWLDFWGLPRKVYLVETAPFLIVGPAEAWDAFDVEIVECEPGCQK